MAQWHIFDFGFIAYKKHSVLKQAHEMLANSPYLFWYVLLYAAIYFDVFDTSLIE